MTIYFFNIVLTSVLARLAQSRGEGNINKRKWMNLFSFLILLTWVLIYSFRALRVGGDTSGYKVQYDWIQNRGFSLEFNLAYQRDIGFAFIQYICSKITNGNWFVYQFVMALLTYVPIIRIYYKHSSDFRLALLLYIFTLCFYHGFNGTRQSIAVGLCLLAFYDGLKERKWVKYFLTMLIAYSFHSTVLLVLPFHFYVAFKKDKRDSQIILILLVGVLSYFLLGGVWSRVISLLDSVGQDKLAADYSTFSGHGSSVVRTVVSYAPVLAILSVKREIRNRIIDDDELMMIVFATHFTLLSQKNWIFARMGLYFSIFIPIVLPKYINIYANNVRQTYRLFICTLYFLYMVFLLLHGEGQYYPYSFYYN